MLEPLSMARTHQRHGIFDCDLAAQVLNAAAACSISPIPVHSCAPGMICRVCGRADGRRAHESCDRSTVHGIQVGGVVKQADSSN